MKALTTEDPLVIGEYRLRVQLGHGGMGRVYLGMSQAGRAVAVKVLHPDLARDGAFLHRFEREVAAARAVSGIYTAPVVATGLADRPPWLATAYVPGPSLDQLVREHGPLPEAALWPLFAGLVEALTAIHGAGIVHRDLKPSNVLIAIDGPRVIDFGISRASDGTSLTATGMVFGSPGYMSPEQALGQRTGPAADVFGLGSLIVFAATGEAPFGEGNAASVLYRVVHDTASLDGVPARLRTVVEGCLAKDPAARPDLGSLATSIAACTPAAGTPALAYWPPRVTGFIAEHQAALETRLAEEAAPEAADDGDGADGVYDGDGGGEATRPTAGKRAAPTLREMPGLREVPATVRSVAVQSAAVRPTAVQPAAERAVAGLTPPPPPPGRPVVPAPPRDVVAAVRLMYAGAAYALFFAVCAWLIAVRHTGHTLVVWQGHWTVRSLRGLFLAAAADLCIQAFLWLWMAWACRRGRRWARPTCTALFACYTLGLGYAVARHTSDGTDRLGTLLFGITWLIGAAALVLLWQRRSTAFFGRNR